MNKKGQNLAELGVILSVVVIAVILALTLLGGNIFTLFDRISNSEGFASDDSQNTGTNNINNASGSSELIPGSLGGTPSKPVSQCDNGACVIDYGEFLLTGIPENFGELVQTTGSSGGTESLIALINQIADQLEKKGDVSGANEFRDLANLGHFMAEVQKGYESVAQACSSDANPINCSSTNSLEDSSGVSLPANLSTILPDFTSTGGIMMDLYKNTDIGSAKANIDGGGKTSVISYAIVDKYQSIMNNPKYSDSTKGVTQELYVQIANLGFNMKGKAIAVLNVASGNSGFNGFQYDPITGAVIGDVNFTINDGINDITHPKTSANTNIRSVLICAGGWNKDTGSNCQ